MEGFRGGLVFKAHRLLYHSTLGVRVIEKKKDLETMSDLINPTPVSVWRYRGISIMKNSAPIGPYSRTMLRALR